MLVPTANLIFKNRKMYIKLYTIWHCNYVEKKRNLNESAIKLVFGFAFLGKLHFYNRRNVASSNSSSWTSLENCIFTLRFFISIIISTYFTKHLISFWKTHFLNTTSKFFKTWIFIKLTKWILKSPISTNRS